MVDAQTCSLSNVANF